MFSYTLSPTRWIRTGRNTAFYLPGRKLAIGKGERREKRE
jgi:hypothetical protein